MEKIISIIIPTFNRRDYLKLTINAFEAQVSRHSELVEMVVCDNDSDDATQSFLNEHQAKNQFYSYINYENRVYVKESFERCISNAHGKYIILWGDDDIPFPFLIDYLLQIIDQHPAIQLFHFNRLIGYDEKTTFNSLFVCDDKYSSDIQEYTICEFLTKYFHEASFMSSIMFTNEAWKEGLHLDSTPYYGYEHLHSIYYGSRRSNVLYIAYPLCFQRKHETRTWGAMWPQFGMIGVPNLLWKLEEEGVISDANAIWYSRFNCFSQFMYNILWASCYKKKYFPMRSYIYKYQTSIFRKLIVFFSLTVIPAFVFNLLKSVYFNMKNK